ncbi:uncharacterized protein LOC143019585 [Oratosquilla oratoria]|uniref:uncharacterized protein LOC143019585 n=1 Tax=Oratosquilla oratoria TaxID=337810 RepID=UPI003F767324
MKTIACLLLFACLANGQQFNGGPPAGGPPGGPAGGPVGGAPGGGGGVGGVGPRFTNPREKFGNQFFGPGLNNPLALPVSNANQRVANQILQMFPNRRVFVGLHGGIKFTDIYGQDDPHANSFYQNLLEQAQERAEQQQEFLEEQREAQLELQQMRLAIQLANSIHQPQQFGNGGGRGFGGGAGNPGGAGGFGGGAGNAGGLGFGI